jgi:predicted membrane channel-forming protein YqfA (hemolysin III family)
MAISGITYQNLYHEKYKWLETCFYVIVGVIPGIVIIDMVCLYKNVYFFCYLLLLDRTYRYI